MHHTIGVLRIDLALHQHAKLLERAFGREDVGDVAERVLVLVELAVLGHVDPPIDDILAVVIARRQPQRLDDAVRRLAVAVDGLVGHLDAHSGATIENRARPVKPASLRTKRPARQG